MGNWFKKNNIKPRDYTIYHLLSICGVDSFNEFVLSINQELMDTQDRQLTVEDFVEISTLWMRNNPDSDKHNYYKIFSDLYDHEIAALQVHLDRIINR